SAWTADFDLWFRWRGDSVRPGESFGVVNGQTLSRERMEARADGDRRFERYRVTARLTKSVDPSRFPFADEVLLVELEDAVHGIDTLRYVAEERGDDIGEPVAPQELDITRSMTVVTTHHYGRGREGVEPLPGGADARSRFVLAVLVQPASGSIYLRMYQALFASVAIALIAFFIKPLHVDPRFGLGIGAFFAAIGNNMFVGTMVPSGGRITLSTMVNGVGLATIFFTLVQSAISLYFLDTRGQARLSRVFDQASFFVLLVGYVLVNVALVMAARP
ncbi:MAG: hypothetical protein OEW19_12135, partial [Acidobacteriota bacterium]|nr:hypothetical protein [Acidobacteriota bacterium]